MVILDKSDGDLHEIMIKSRGHSVQTGHDRAYTRIKHGVNNGRVVLVIILVLCLTKNQIVLSTRLLFKFSNSNSFFRAVSSKDIARRDLYTNI